MLCPASAVLAGCRLRWRVELAFKWLKGGLGIDRLLARDPAMARSWLLSHLILALLIEDNASEVLDSPPCMALLAPTLFPCGACKRSSGLRCSAPF